MECHTCSLCKISDILSIMVLVFIDAEDEITFSNSSSPLLAPSQDHTRAKHLLATLKAAGTASPSPFLRRRHLHHDPEVFAGRQPDLSMLDTASIYSSPSMFSLHSAVEGEGEGDVVAKPSTEKIEVWTLTVLTLIRPLLGTSHL